MIIWRFCLILRPVHLHIVKFHPTHSWRSSVTEAKVSVPFISEKKVMLVINGKLQNTGTIISMSLFKLRIVPSMLCVVLLDSHQCKYGEWLKGPLRGECEEDWFLFLLRSVAALCIKLILRMPFCFRGRKEGHLRFSVHATHDSSTVLDGNLRALRSSIACNYWLWDHDNKLRISSTRG